MKLSLEIHGEDLHTILAHITTSPVLVAACVLAAFALIAWIAWLFLGR
jgi:hypothetical protein